MDSIGTRSREHILPIATKAILTASRIVFFPSEFIFLILFVNKHINSKGEEADAASIWVFRVCKDWWGPWWFWSSSRRSTCNPFSIATSFEIAATYWSLHTFKSPSVSNVLTISSILIDVFIEMSFKLHQQSVSFSVCMIINVQNRR